MKQEMPDIFKDISPAANVEADYLQNQADQVIESLTQTYLKNVHLQIADMRRYIAEARALTGPDRLRLVQGNLFRTAHDMKGQGATFGFPLLTEIGAAICDRIRNLKEVNLSLLDMIEELTADMDTIIQFPPHAQNSVLSGIEKRLNRLREEAL